jgi:type IV fimbrial biogenesis protein FimT
MKIQTGFTLVEMMVTLAVGIIILAIGVPAFINMLSTNLAAGYANDLVGAIRLARSEAVKRGSSVTICASNATQTNCSGNDWNNGWIVFLDDNADSGYSAGEEILRVWSIPTDERADLIFEASSPNAIRYDAAGANAAEVTVQFAFRRSDCEAVQARQVTVSIMGRPSLDYVACF